MTRELWIMEVERDAAGRVQGTPTALGKASGEVVDDVLALLVGERFHPVTLAREEEPAVELKAGTYPDPEERPPDPWHQEQTLRLGETEDPTIEIGECPRCGSPFPDDPGPECAGEKS